MKIHAAVLRELGKSRPFSQSKPLVAEAVDLGDPGPGEVLVEVAAAGLCHSDLSTLLGVRPRPLPLVPGHEAAGIVRAVGPGVGDLAVGDHVVTTFVSRCGHCAYCYDGRPNLCERSQQSRARGTLPSGARRLSAGGVALNHQSGLSVFAEYAVVSSTSLVRIDSDIPFADAALFGCAVMTGVGAVINTAHVRPGTTVAVVGLGGVGLSAVMGALVAGAGRIVAVDVSDAKLKLALDLGATDTVSARDPHCAENVREMTSGGVRYAFDMAGVRTATEAAYSMLGRGGLLVIAGLPGPKSALSIPIATMVADERAVTGSYMGSCVPGRDIPRYLGLYRRGYLPVGRLRSGTVTLDTINEGFDRLANGESTRDLLVFGATPA